MNIPMENTTNQCLIWNPKPLCFGSQIREHRSIQPDADWSFAGIGIGLYLSWAFLELSKIIFLFHSPSLPVRSPFEQRLCELSIRPLAEGDEENSAFRRMPDSNESVFISAVIWIEKLNRLRISPNGLGLFEPNPMFFEVGRVLLVVPIRIPQCQRILLYIQHRSQDKKVAGQPEEFCRCDPLSSSLWTIVVAIGFDGLVAAV
jgi:hypothetical protein